MNISQIKLLFPHNNISCEDNHKMKEIESKEVIDSTDNELTQLLFAPDPETGIPRSDIAVLMSRDTRPEIANYIRDNLLRPRQHSAGVDNADIALELTQSRYERLNEYAVRLHDMVKPNVDEQ